MGTATPPAPSPVRDMLVTELGKLPSQLATAVTASPLTLAVVCVAAVIVLVTAYRAARWWPLALAGKDPLRRFTGPDRAILLARAGHRCEHHTLGLLRCPTTANLEADHIHPHSKGGRTHVANGQVLCRQHNRAKRARIPYSWELRLLARGRAAYFPPGADPVVVRRPST